MQTIKKLFIYVVFYPLLTLIVLLVLFFFWGSSSNWQEKDYAKVIQSPHTKFPTAVSDTFSIITYNIGYLSGMLNNTSVAPPLEFMQQNLAGITDVLNQAKPDYLAAQEVDLYAARSHRIDQGEAISKAIGFPNWARVVSWDKRYLPFPYTVSGHFGQLVSGQTIFSQTPIQTHQRIVLDKVASQPAYYQAFYLDRLIQIITTQRNGRSLAIMNVHLDHSDEETRVKQTQEVLATFEQLDQTFDGVILLGDFNSYLHAPKQRPPSVDEKEDMMIEQNPTIRAVLAHPLLRPAIPDTLQHNPENFTFDAKSPHEKIDYIFYNPSKLNLIQAQVLQSQSPNEATPSDHLPVYARFTFSR